MYISGGRIWEGVQLGEFHILSGRLRTEYFSREANGIYLPCVQSKFSLNNICPSSAANHPFAKDPPNNRRFESPGPERYSRSDPQARSRPPIFSRWDKNPPSRASLTLRSFHSCRPTIKPSNFRAADFFLPPSLSAVKSNRPGTTERLKLRLSRVPH